MPSDFGPGTRLFVQQGTLDSDVRHVRVEIGSDEPILFPIMEMRRERAGVEEAELSFSHKFAALRMSLVIRRVNIGTGSSCSDITFRSSLMGHTFRECKKAIDAIDRIEQGARIRFIDIQSSKLIAEGEARELSGAEDAFPTELREYVSLVAQIEKHFGLSIEYPASVTDQDDEVLFFLDCLLNDRKYSDGLTCEFEIVKGDGNALTVQRQLISGEPMQHFIQPNQLENLSLFGHEIKTPPWGLKSVAKITAESGPTLAEFDAAPEGTAFVIELQGTEPIYLELKSQAGIP